MIVTYFDVIVKVHAPDKQDWLNVLEKANKKSKKSLYDGGKKGRRDGGR